MLKLIKNWYKKLAVLLLVPLVALVAIAPAGISITGEGILSLETRVALAVQQSIAGDSESEIRAAENGEHNSLVFFDGFETGDFGMWNTVTGTPTIEETIVKTGDYAAKFSSTGSSVYAYSPNLSDASSGTFSFRFNTAPSGDTRIMYLRTGVILAELWLTSARKLKVANVTGGTVLDVDTYYRISWYIYATTVQIEINGSAELGATEGADGNPPSIRIGVYTSGQTIDFYIDDIVIGDSTSEAEGDIRVLRSSPNAAGAHAEFDTISGYENCDEVPADGETTIVDDSGVGTIHRETYNLQDWDTIGGGASDTIEAVNVWVQGYDTGASLQGITVRDDGTDYETLAEWGKAYGWRNKLYLEAPQAAPWTPAIFDAFQAGAYSEGSKDVWVSSVMVMVAFIPAAVGEADISNAPASKDFGAVATSTDYWSSGSEPNWPLDDGESFFTVTNNGSTCSITIEATNFIGGVGWTLGVPAENVARLKAGVSGDANEGAMVTLTTSPLSFISGLAGSGTEKWEVLLETPTAFTDGVEKISTITLTATLD